MATKHPACSQTSGSVSQPFHGVAVGLEASQCLSQAGSGNLQRCWSQQWHTQLSICTSPLPRQRQPPAQLLSALPGLLQNTQHGQGTPVCHCHGEVSKGFHFPLSLCFPASQRISPDCSLLTACSVLLTTQLSPSQHYANTDLTHPLPHLSTSDTPSTPTAQQVPFKRQTNHFLTLQWDVCFSKQG